MSAIDRHIGERIRARRLELNLSQEQLAATIGVTFQQVQKYERGFNRVSAATLYRICKALDVGISSLLPPAKAQSGKAAAEDPIIEELAQIARRLDSESRKALLDHAKTLAQPSARRRVRKKAPSA